MPVLDRATADAILDRTPPSHFYARFHAIVRDQQDAPITAELLQPLDERVLRALLRLHAAGRHFVTPIGLGQRLGKKVVSVRNSLDRLRRYGLLPFEVRS